MASMTTRIAFGVVLLVYTVWAADPWHKAAVTVNHHRPPRDLSELEERYKISEPFYRYNQLRFDLDYWVNDDLDETEMGYTVFDKTVCGDVGGGANDITENRDYLASRLRPSLEPKKAGLGTKLVKVSLTINPRTISESSVFEDFEEYAVVQFCVRFGVYSEDSLLPTAVELNFVETVVSLKLDLRDAFDPPVAFALTQSQLLEQLTRGTSVIGYLCDRQANVVEIGTTNQGQAVRVCVTPTDNVLATGIVLRRIEEFAFTREDGDVRQDAIAAGTDGKAANLQTIVQCQPGWRLCAFETILRADFFANGPGTLLGRGTAILQFGTGNATFAEPSRYRQLQPPPRYLQESSAQDDDPAYATRFGFEIDVVPGKPKDQSAAAGGAQSSWWWCLAVGSLMWPVVVAA